MSYDIGDLVAHLPRVDARPEAADRVRREACALLHRGRSAPGRARVRVTRIYTRVLEPVLLLGTIVLSLSWAVARILYITGAG